MEIYDKTGREIMIGDVVKVYHFTASIRRKRHYMYKQATHIREWPSGFRAAFFNHLNMSDDGYYMPLDGTILADYEIVSSIDAAFGDRPRKASNV